MVGKIEGSIIVSEIKRLLEEAEASVADHPEGFFRDYTAEKVYKFGYITQGLNMLTLDLETMETEEFKMLRGHLENEG